MFWFKKSRSDETSNTSGKGRKSLQLLVSTPVYCLDYGIANTDDKLGRFIDDFIGYKFMMEFCLDCNGPSHEINDFDSANIEHCICALAFHVFSNCNSSKIKKIHTSIVI